MTETISKLRCSNLEKAANGKIRSGSFFFFSICLFFALGIFTLKFFHFKASKGNGGITAHLNSTRSPSSCVAITIEMTSTHKTRSQMQSPENFKSLPNKSLVRPQSEGARVRIRIRISIKGHWHSGGGVLMGNFGRLVWLWLEFLMSRCLSYLGEIAIFKVFYINSTNSNRTWINRSAASNQAGYAAMHNPTHAKALARTQPNARNSQCL